MLQVFFGDMPGAIYNTATYFRNTYQDSWFEDEFAQRMIKSVDKATVLGNRLIDSKVLGLIPPTDLSGGVKTLLLVYNQPDKVFNASTCGDNCAYWLLRIGAKKNVTINLRHVMDFGNGRFSIKVLNNNQVLHSMDEMVVVAGTILGSQRGDA